MPVEILVAITTGGFGVVIALITKNGRRSSAEHGGLSRAVGRIEQKLDDHLDGHP